MRTTSEVVIQFDRAGNATCLYTEALPLENLGRLAIRRASTIERNNDTALWEVRIRGKVQYTNASRKACQEWEHVHFNGILKEGGSI